MRLRNQPLGSKNLIGARVESARKEQGMKQKELLAQLQVRGVDLSASGLSKLEGQVRYVTDFELLALADILSVSVQWLLTGEEKENKPPRAVCRGDFFARSVVYPPKAAHTTV